MLAISTPVLLPHRLGTPRRKAISDWNVLIYEYKHSYILI